MTTEKEWMPDFTLPQINAAISNLGHILSTVPMVSADHNLMLHAIKVLKIAKGFVK